MRIIYGDATLDVRKATRMSALLKFYMLTEIKKFLGLEKIQGRIFSRQMCVGIGLACDLGLLL